MNGLSFVDEHGHNFKNEKNTFHGIKFIHEIMVARRDISECRGSQ
jgi:hypothetical protein